MLWSVVGGKLKVHYPRLGIMVMKGENYGTGS